MVVLKTELGYVTKYLSNQKFNNSTSPKSYNN